MYELYELRKKFLQNFIRITLTKLADLVCFSSSFKVGLQKKNLLAFYCFIQFPSNLLLKRSGSLAFWCAFCSCHRTIHSRRAKACGKFGCCCRWSIWYWWRRMCQQISNDAGSGWSGCAVACVCLWAAVWAVHYGEPWKLFHFVTVIRKQLTRCHRPFQLGFFLN